MYSSCSKTRDVVMVEHPRLQPVGAGLYNVDNTCFANAVVQSLLHTEVREIISNHNHALRGDESCTWCCLKDASEASTEVPQYLDRNIPAIIPDWISGEQQDAHEFMVTLFEKLKIESQTQSEQTSLSQLTDLKLQSIGFEMKDEIESFKNYFRCTVKCRQCNASRQTGTVHSHLQVDVKGVSLMDAIRSTLSWEKLPTDVYLNCPSCNQNTNVEVSGELSHLPPLLILHLKRFFYNKQGAGKITTLLSYPEMLNIADRKGKDTEYILAAVIVHIGSSVAEGHYITYAHTCEGWFKFDDTKVERVNISDALRQQAYLLLYESHRKTTEVCKATSAVSHYCVVSLQHNKKILNTT